MADKLDCHGYLTGRHGARLGLWFTVGALPHTPVTAHLPDLLFPGEASASTMWDNNAWTFFYDNSTDGEPPFLTQDFIHAFQPDAKLIVMLRDPVER
jgi:hypothetical protein